MELLVDLRPPFVLAIGAAMGVYVGHNQKHETAYVIGGLLVGYMMNSIIDYFVSVDGISNA
jgi:hypothetical protein